MARLAFWVKVLAPLGLLLLLVGLWLNWTLARPVGQVAIYGEVQYTDLESYKAVRYPGWMMPFGE